MFIRTEFIKTFNIVRLEKVLNYQLKMFRLLCKILSLKFNTSFLKLS